jgi:methyl-accepting chemotaxis protein
VNGNIPAITALGDLRAAAAQTQVDMAMQATAADDGTRANYTGSVDQDMKAFAAALAAYRDLRPGEAAGLDALEQKWAFYQHIATTALLPAGERSDLPSWQIVRNAEVAPLMSQVSAQLGALAEHEQGDVSKTSAHAHHVYVGGRTRAVVLLVLAFVIAGSLAFLVSNGLVGPLRRVQAVCEALAAGDLTATLEVTSRDEVGKMSEALNTASRNIRDVVASIDTSAETLSGAAAGMASISSQIARSAEDVTRRTVNVATVAAQVSQSVDIARTGGEEMTSSIQEIATSASAAAAVAGQAVDAADRTNETVAKLGESSRQIGDVVKVITSIAEQTNLLALNATIEAARAGEAGKGFAVVASEVKDLAQETARATDDISQRVDTIQRDAAAAVAAISEISSVIGRISEHQQIIAGTVEEQHATTGAISRSVAEAATGTADIASSMTSVADAAGLTSDGVLEAERAAVHLSQLSVELNELVDRFRY